MPSARAHTHTHTHTHTTHTHTRREAVGMRANEALARLAGTDLPELRSR